MEEGTLSQTGKKIKIIPLVGKLELAVITPPKGVLEVVIDKL